MFFELSAGNVRLCYPSSSRGGEIDGHNSELRSLIIYDRSSEWSGLQIPKQTILTHLMTLIKPGWCDQAFINTYNHAVVRASSSSGRVLAKCGLR
jgi:hypothetical protein